MKQTMFKITIAILTIFMIGLAVGQAQTKSKKQNIQRVTVSVTRSGYEPESFNLKKGLPARITFIRKVEGECGEVVVFPSYGIKRTLPLNKPVEIRIVPKRTGTFSYACGMDMLRGSVIVS